MENHSQKSQKSTHSLFGKMVQFMSNLGHLTQNVAFIALKSTLFLKNYPSFGKKIATFFIKMSEWKITHSLTKILSALLSENFE